jgi:phosphoribosyl-ATP pyrophosphohydrolase/phosphoribosyl-AMP cyclohydrolase
MNNMSQSRTPLFSSTDALLPAIVQHADSREVLMLGYMNREAYDQTVSSGRVTFFSRSKQRLWMKGESSGNVLDVVELLTDCDRDAILVKARPAGPTCHTGDDTCFGESIRSGGISFLEHLAETIRDRRTNPSPGSYTSSLFDAGIDRLAQKVGEEGVETVIAAKNESLEKLHGEAADLIFHLMVLLEFKGTSLGAVCSELSNRHRR